MNEGELEVYNLKYLLSRRDLFFTQSPASFTSLRSLHSLPSLPDQSQHTISLPARHLHHFNMKTQSLIVSVLAGIATASPLAIEVRQSTNVGITANEYTRGGCKDVIFFFARGSTEIGNMVSCPESDTAARLFQRQTNRFSGEHRWTSHWRRAEESLRRKQCCC